jgi:hypothetical protein
MAQTYRNKQIDRIVKELQVERDMRQLLFNKCQKLNSVLDGIDYTLYALGAGLCITGLITLTTIPITIAAEAGALLFTTIGVIIKVIRKKELIKARKHDVIRLLAENAINKITEIMSNSLEDELICNIEMKKILVEYEAFKFAKSKTRVEARKGLSNIENPKL